MKAKRENPTHEKVASGQQGEAGFTLVEVSIALVVMMIVGLGAASLFVYAMGSNSRARDRGLSMAVAQQQMELLRNATFSTIDARVTATGGANKQVTSGSRPYDVTTTVTTVGDDKTITITVTPTGTSLTGLTAAQLSFGTVRLVTKRASDTLGPNFYGN